MKKFFCYGKKDFCEDFCPPTKSCPHYDGSGGEYQDAPMTNADRIRAMSDDELAEAISSIPMCVGTDDDKDCENDGCKGCFLKWLQQPAKEADHESV